MNYQQGNRVMVYGPILFAGDAKGSAIDKRKGTVIRVNNLDNGSGEYLSVVLDEGTEGVVNPRQCRKLSPAKKPPTTKTPRRIWVLEDALKRISESAKFSSIGATDTYVSDKQVSAQDKEFVEVLK